MAATMIRIRVELLFLRLIVCAQLLSGESEQLTVQLTRRPLRNRLRSSPADDLLDAESEPECESLVRVGGLCER